VATETAVDVVMPQMGVSVSEGTITKWMKSEGDSVAADESLLEISTDKVDTEVPSPASGVLRQILAQEGETVAVGTKIAVIAPEGAEVEEAPAPPTAAAAEETAAVSGAEGEVPTAAQPEEAPPAAPAAPAPAAAEPRAEPTEEDGRREGTKFVSPVVARIAAEHDVDVSRVEGTGRGGRVTKKDILAYIEAEPQRGETVEPMTAMRKGIAEHMRRSLDTSAHVTTTFEVDMSKVVAIREQLKTEYAERHSVKLTYLPFIARATVEAIGNWPWMNAELRGESIVVKSYVNLGIAVALEGGKGLIVPVVKNAEEKNLLGMARAIIDVAERARSKKLMPDDVQGGTFTITNPGGFGAVHGTPIISQPQVGILDVEALVKRPVVIQDEAGKDVIAIRPMMNLCLSYDHRLVDGAYAAQFMRELKTSLETWDESAY
jgi:2-oxoglutarate dehydrogenase E2 component (dihydrolipoamide succinyltransferase)